MKSLLTGGKKKIVKCFRTLSTKLDIRMLHVFDMAKTDGKCAKGKNAHAKGAKLFSLSC